MMRRDKNGRFKPGGSMSRETKRKISATLRARNAQAPEPVERKRCNTCKEWKVAERDFYKKSHYTKSRGKVVGYSSSCKLCDRKRIRAWEERLRQEDPEAFRQRKLAQDKRRRKKPERLRYQSEHKRMNRAIRGSKPRPSAQKYKSGGKLELKPAQPFVEWYLGLNGNRPTEEMMGDAVARAVRRAVYGGPESAERLEDRRIRLDVVDDVGVLVGVVHLVHLLYGE